MRGKRAKEIRKIARSIPIPEDSAATGTTWRTVYRRAKRNYTRGRYNKV